MKALNENEKKADTCKPAPGMELQAMPYALPDNYLPTLPKLLADGVAAQSEDEPVLQASHDMPFVVPQDYFGRLSENLVAGALHAADRRSKRRIIPMYAGRRLMRMAAAAVIVLGIGIGAYRYAQPHSPDAVVVKELRSVPVETLDDYMAQYADGDENEAAAGNATYAQTEAEAAIRTLDASEIESYLSEADATL